MDSTTVALIERYALQAREMFQSVAPDVWEMAKMRVWAGIVIPPVMSLLVLLFFIVSIVYTKKAKWKNEINQEGGLIFLVVFGFCSMIVFLVCLGLGLYDLIAIDYCTLRTITGLIK